MPADALPALCLAPPRSPTGPSSGRGITSALAYIVEAKGTDAMAQRATMALGVLPTVRWAELDSPWTSGADLLTIELAHGRSLTLALKDPEDEPIASELGQLLGVVAAMIEREHANERLAAEARTDALTGLWNRRAFEEMMDQGLSRSARSDEHVALLLCDIDHFKEINDGHGHEAGDQALIAVADAMRTVTRPSDVAARVGGDEIAVFLAGCDAEGGRHAANRLRRAVAANSGDYPVTLSIGVVEAHMLDAPGPNPATRTAMLRMADEALYMAKRAGRDQAVVHPGKTEPPISDVA